MKYANGKKRTILGRHMHGERRFHCAHCGEFHTTHQKMVEHLWLSHKIKAKYDALSNYVYSEERG